MKWFTNLFRQHEACSTCGIVKKLEAQIVTMNRVHTDYMEAASKTIGEKDAEIFKMKAK